MKKWTYILLGLFLLLFVSACDHKKDAYVISINENVAVEYYLGEEIDFKAFFIIKNHEGKLIPVKDSMIDTSNVSFDEEGTYKVKIAFQGLIKNVSITLVKPERLDYVITVNENVLKEIELGDLNFDFTRLFSITDSNDIVILVTSAMIDSSDVDFFTRGTYEVKVTYLGIVKVVEVKVLTHFEIVVNQELPTTFEVGASNVDFKSYFTIKHQDGSVVEVEDEMIDATNVDLSKEGIYTVRITYLSLTKEIQIHIISSPVTYEIVVNEALPTTFEVGVSIIDFKAYFTIKDSNGGFVEVEDEMIDATRANLSSVGTFTIQIKYEDLVKTLEFSIVAVQNKNATDLFISEYAEAKNYDKYIEIFNGTGKEVDLSIYTLMLFNKAEQPAQYAYPLSGTLKDGEILVVYNPQASKLIKASGGVSHQVINFNGDDVIALYKNEILLDVVGDLSNPVSVGWAVSGIQEATKDHTLIRKSSVVGPNSTWSEEEWIVQDIEDFSNIKLHTMDNYKPITEDEEDIRVKDLFISEYFEGIYEFKDSKYIEIYNPFNETISLSSYSLAVYKEGSLQASFVQPLQGELESHAVYVVYAPYSAEAITSQGNLSSEVCYFNGKAAAALLKDGVVIDVIGVIGEKPQGDGWPVDDYSSTANNTIIRKEMIDSPTTKWNPEEWYSCYENYLYGLGFHDQASQEDIVYDNFDALFRLIQDLPLDSKGTATSADPVRVKGTVFMDVQNETTLVYLTDGRNFIKLHGEKIHNYTSVGQVYEVVCHYKAHLYQPTLEVQNPDTDITRLDFESAVTEIEVLEVTLDEILALKKEDFVYNIAMGYLQSMLQIKGYLQLDTHNSSKYDYCLTVNETYTKNKTGYINNGLYFKNDVRELEEYLIDYEVDLDYENIEITIFGVLYDWNPNRSDWRIYVSDELTIFSLPA